MAFEKNVPLWEAAGTEPPEDLKKSGFTAGFKPPAAYFNWFWTGVSEALTELQGMSPDDIGAMKKGTVPVTSGGTGATEAAGAIQNLLIRTAINASSAIDCNTLTGVGIYKVYIADGEPADYNLPNRYGILFVLSSMEWTGYDYVSQLFYDVLDNALYQRTSSDKGTTWKDWIRFYAPNYKPSADDVGAANSNHKHSAADINSGALALEYGGTGGTTKNEAVKNLLVNEIMNTSNVVDCNTLINVRIQPVYIESGVSPADYNYPGRYGILFVLGSMNWTNYDYVSQVFFEVSSNTLYQRTSSNAGTTWQEWAKVYSTGNKPTAADVGITSGTTDLTAGTSALATGEVYFVYE